MKVLKISSLSGLNVGDALISICIERLLDSDDLEVISMDMEGRELADRSSGSAERKSFYRLVIDRIPFLRYLLKMFKVRYFTAPAALQVVTGYDAVIFGGGNMFFNFIGCPYLYFYYRLAKGITGKKIYIYSVGVGPFDYGWKTQLKFILNKAEKVTVRDEVSYEYSRSVLSNSDVLSIGYDPVFVLSDIYPIIEGVEKKYISVNIMEYSENFYPGFDQDIDTVCENLKKLSDYFSLSVKLLITSYEDLNINLKVFDKLKSMGVPVELIRLAYNSDFSKVYSDVKFSLCNRMHASIFSLSYNLPTLVFFWQDKVVGLAKTLLSDDYDLLSVDVNFDFNQVVSKINNFPQITFDESLIEVKESIYEDARSFSMKIRGVK